MIYRNWLKIRLFGCALFPAASVYATTTYGIVGGEDNTTPGPGTPYVAFVNAFGVANSLMGDTPTGNGNILSVAINSSGAAIIGGTDNSFDSYAARVSPSGVASLLTGNPPSGGGAISAVAINPCGAAIIGGTHMGSPIYLALVTPSGVAKSITGDIPTGTGNINTVDINSSGVGIAGGRYVAQNTPYVVRITPSGVASFLTGDIPDPTPIGQILSVAINDSGTAIIGGVETTTKAYVAQISPSGAASFLTGDAPTGNGRINSVAINPSGTAIIGGSQNGNKIYCALVSPTKIATSVTGDLPIGNTGAIQAVDINPSGAAIIAGQYNMGVMLGLPYAALVSPSGVATSITGDIVTKPGEYLTVAIAPSGAGLIGGTDSSSNPYAALVTPSGVAISLTGALPTGTGFIYSVAISLSEIPTASLSGNNLHFSNYINEFSSENAFYFVPAFCAGTLAGALESAAPTRNAISLYTASHNLFYLTTSLAAHIRDQRLIHHRRGAVLTPNDPVASKANHWESENQLLASNSLPIQRQSTEKPPCEKNRPYTIWFEAIGALAYQKPQNQTPGFNPTTGGGILAFDAAICENAQVGGGVSYLYTHIHEKKGAGHSNIKQEDLFIFASWDNNKFYVDGSLWGGLFQTRQVRNIHMTGFDFTASSNPDGWQLLPHLELGFNINAPKYPQNIKLTFNPFAMLDWSNAWQSSYREKGDGPFNAAQKSHYSSLLRTEAGFRFYQTLFFDCWDLIFLEKGSYVNTQSFGTGKMNAFLVGSPGTFTVETLTSAQNLGVAQFAMIFSPLNPRFPTSTLLYQGEFGRKYQSHQVNLEVAWSF